MPVTQYPLILQYNKSDTLIDPKHIIPNQLIAMYYNNTMETYNNLIIETNTTSHDHYYVLGFSNNYNVVVAPDSLLFISIVLTNREPITVEKLFLDLTNNLHDNTNIARPTVTSINTFKQSQIIPSHLTFSSVNLIEITKIDDELLDFTKLKFKSESMEIGSVLVSISELDKPPIYVSMVL